MSFLNGFVRYVVTYLVFMPVGVCAAAVLGSVLSLFRAISRHDIWQVAEAVLYGSLFTGLTWIFWRIFEAYNEQYPLNK